MTEFECTLKVNNEFNKLLDSVFDSDISKFYHKISKLFCSLSVLDLLYIFFFESVGMYVLHFSMSTWSELVLMKIIPPEKPVMIKPEHVVEKSFDDSQFKLRSERKNSNN